MAVVHREREHAAELEVAAPGAGEVHSGIGETAKESFSTSGGDAAGLDRICMCIAHSS